VFGCSLLFVDGRHYLVGWWYGGMPMALQGPNTCCLLDVRDYTYKLVATAGPGARTIRVSRGLRYEDKNVDGDEGSTRLEIDLRPYLLSREAPERVVRVGTKDRFTLILTGRQEGKVRQAQVAFDRAYAFPIRRVVASVQGEAEMAITFATSVKTLVPSPQDLSVEWLSRLGFPVTKVPQDRPRAEMQDVAAAMQALAPEEMHRSLERLRKLAERVPWAWLSPGPFGVEGPAGPARE
jgi:hypothetical protein